jgi:MoaA/NifB/PqqE/SkfB family radical SAM enzyme
MLPLFRPYIQGIIETASALGIHVVVFTNGSLLDRQLLSFLRQHNTSLIISIKYFDAEKYNQNVGRTMFEVIRKKIHLVQEVFAHIETIDGYRIYNF